MTLRLVIEHAPHPQRQSERTLEGGELSIGRGPECDWQLDDPDMFISRKHCVISGQDGEFTVTDASRSGLFLDGRDKPLGAGVAVRVENGMRLRMGDLVMRADVVALATRRPEPVRTSGASPLLEGFEADDFFAPRAPAPPPPSRPESLPQPFEGGPAPFSAPKVQPQRQASPPLFDDPFTMDPVPTPGPEVTEPASLSDLDFSFGDPVPPERPQTDIARVRERTVPTPLVDAPPAAPVQLAAPHPTNDPPQAPPRADDTGMIQAYFRGLGLDPASLPGGGTEAEMEALGLRFRLLADGLVQLLRTRAREKSSVRVAQTVIGSAEVNPLKFLATTEDALAALVAPRGKGYLKPEDAINAAFRDLSDHQMRTWTALQSALRRMIDRFDPAAFETEVETVGLIKSLIAGSRSARLWQLYEERYRDIAKSAEDRFLGDVGADFRDAYEGKRRTENE